MTKQEIFDQYAEELEYESFEALIEDFQDIRFSYDELMKHISNATDLVCKQALENASENVTTSGCYPRVVNLESITNFKNIPK